MVAAGFELPVDEPVLELPEPIAPLLDELPAPDGVVEELPDGLGDLPIVLLPEEEPFMPLPPVDDEPVVLEPLLLGFVAAPFDPVAPEAWPTTWLRSSLV